MIVMPNVKQVVSPNYSPTLIASDLFVFHDQEGHTLTSVAWLCNPAANASAQGCLSEDGKTLYQLTPWRMKAWHACAFNSRGPGLEIPGFAAKGFSDDLLRVAALIGAWHCRAYGLPPVWAKGGQGRGICCHHDLGSAGGGHTDVGPVGGEAWTKLLQFTQAAYDELGAGPLPVFALNGAPGPHEVVATPDVTPAPSHGGAARNEPGDTHAHDTPSAFPAHSIAALQFDLNKIDPAQPIDVDGWFGAMTVVKLKRFQATHGLRDDGLIGPLTWAVVEAAMKIAA